MNRENIGRPIDPERHPLTQLRLAQGWTMGELASLAGICANTVCNIERGNTCPRPFVRQNLLAVFEIPESAHLEIFGPSVTFERKPK